MILDYPGGTAFICRIRTRALPRATINYYTIAFDCIYAAIRCPRIKLTPMSHTHSILGYIGLAFASCLILFASGCGGGDDAVPVATNPEDVMEMWRTLMDTPSQSTEDPELRNLTVRIGEIAPRFVGEMIARLEDTSLSGEKMIVLVASLEEVVSPERVDQLVALTGPDKSGAARRSATHLLGFVSSDEAKAALEGLRQDEMETVRLTALVALARHGDESVGPDLREIYQREDVMALTRERVVKALCMVPSDEDRVIFENAIQTVGSEQMTYLTVASAMGRIGTPESIEALNALKARPDCSVGVREMCDNSIAAIEERFDVASASTG